jgi:CBS domain-containing protein
MIAKDVMTTAVVTVRAQTSVEDVAKLLLKRRISAVRVVDAKGRIQGIVSEGDLIRRVESGTESHRSWWLDILANRDRITFDYVKSHGRTAGDVMTRDVITVGERTPLAKIATLLERHRIKRVPVVRTGKVVGIVSRANLLHGLAAQKTAGGTVAGSDREIRSRILKELDKAGVNKSYLNVVVMHSEAEFWGLVDSEAQKRALRVAAENVKGLKRIIDNVTVIAPMLSKYIGTV